MVLNGNVTQDGVIDTLIGIYGTAQTDQSGIQRDFAQGTIPIGAYFAIKTKIYLNAPVWGPDDVTVSFAYGNEAISAQVGPGAWVDIDTIESTPQTSTSTADDFKILFATSGDLAPQNGAFWLKDLEIAIYGFQG